MQNNLVLTLKNKEKYYILSITYYNDERYYITNHLSKDLEVSEEFVIFREYIENSKVMMQKIDDVELIYQILVASGFTD